MRRVAVVLFAAAMVLPVGMGVSPAGAAGTAAISCTTASSTLTFSPPLPAPGDPTTVTPTVTTVETFSGCVGLGITGGTATSSGVSSDPVNCDIVNSSQDAALPDPVGPGTITWSNGQTSTGTSQEALYGFTISSGLFTGGYVHQAGATASTAPVCVNSSLATLTFTGTSSGLLVLTLPGGTAACAPSQPCNKTQMTSATATAPGLNVEVTGTPTSGVGTMRLTIAPGVLTCPRVRAVSLPVATLTDSGFSSSDRLNVTATLPLASATSAEQVCFHSTVPFKSQSSPTVAKAGTAFLLNCTQVANVAPCVLSSQQVGSNLVVKFVAPGGDPTFSIVSPTGREAWASRLETGTVGTAYLAQFQTRGGKAPFHWNLSGSLPPGCAFHAATGTITGTPTTKGKYKVALQATDSEKPKGKKTQSLSVPIIIT